MTTDEKKVLGVLEQIKAHEQGAIRLGLLADQLERDAQEAKLRNELEETFEHDLSEGTVESLLRAKDKMNSVLDALIARAIGEV